MALRLQLVLLLPQLWASAVELPCRAQELEGEASQNLALMLMVLLLPQLWASVVELPCRAQELANSTVLACP